MKQRFLEAYCPHHQNSIDEAMIPFKVVHVCVKNAQYIQVHTQYSAQSQESVYMWLVTVVHQLSSVHIKFTCLQLEIILKGIIHAHAKHKLGMLMIVHISIIYVHV